MEPENALPLSPKETQDADQRTAPSVGVVYESIRREGQLELERTTAALLWSGLAAGLSMGFSLLAQGLLRAHLPEGPWNLPVSRAGYCMGFVIVILARQQLFTENTLTPILPLFRNHDRGTLLHVVRLWATVLLANLAGAWLVALAFAKGGILTQEVQWACLRVAEEGAAGSSLQCFARGIVAGWLIALMVWMLPAAHYSRVTIIMLVTYLVALAELSHVIAGAIEVFYLVVMGRARWDDAAAYIGPTLVGNVLGGIALTAALAHAQTAPRRPMPPGGGHRARWRGSPS